MRPFFLSGDFVLPDPLSTSLASSDLDSHRYRHVLIARSSLPSMTGRLRFVAAVFAMLFGAGASASAQGQESASSALFPTAARVVADYPDDANRWGALTWLYRASMDRLPNGQYKASYQKSTEYQQTIGSIQEKYHLGTPQADKAFADRITALSRDRAFGQQVLARYHLDSLPTGPATRPAPQPAANPEVELQKAVPWWLATIALMGLVAWYRVSRPVTYPIAPAPSGDAIALPESLRVVHVPGSTYALEIDAGQVLEEKTWTETHYSTYTTQGSVQQLGDTLYVFPGRQQMTATTVQKDRFWLRDAAGRESAWVISGGVFTARVGHILSRVGTREGENVDFIVACNHSTEQCVVFNGSVKRYHGAPTRRAWLISTLIGTLGWVVGGWNLIPLLGQDSFAMALLSFAILGLIGSVLIGLFLTSWIQTRIFLRRNAYFARTYLPAIRKFLLEQSPAVIARFGAASRA
jgi:hypothetical protein